MEGDGIYSVIWNGYTDNGVYDIRVAVDDTNVTPLYTSEGVLAAKLPQRTNPSDPPTFSDPIATPNSTPISTGLRVVVRGVPADLSVADDHEDDPTATKMEGGITISACTEVSADNEEVTGKIDLADDVDCFRLTDLDNTDYLPTNEDLVIRLTDLIAADRYKPTFTVYDNTGTSEVATWSPNTNKLQSGGLILTIPTATVDTVGMIVSVQDANTPGVADWSYNLSAGKAIVSDAEDYTTPAVNAITLSLSRSNQPIETITEGASANTITVTATLDSPLERDNVEVTLGVSGARITEGSPGDYTLSSNTLTISTGNTNPTQTVSLSINDDDIMEGEEMLEIYITRVDPFSVNNNTPSTTPRRLRITDDDAATVSLRVASATGDFACTDSTSSCTKEGGSVSITATSDKMVAQDVTVTLAPVTDISTEGSADYEALSSQTVTIPAGSDTSNTATLTAKTDDVIEGDETLEVSISGVSSALGTTVTGSSTSVSVTIEERESSVVRVSVASLGRESSCDDVAVTTATMVSITESEGVCITASLSDTSLQLSEAVTVTLTASGTSTAGDTDFTSIPIAQPSTLTLSAMRTNVQATLMLMTADDSTVEENKTLILTPSIADGALVSLAPGQEAISVTIRDNDVPSLSLSVPRSERTVSEGGSATITAMLSEAVNASVTVTLSATSSSTAVAEEYLLPTITIAANELSATGTLSITDDEIVEGDETIEVYIETITSTESLSNETSQERAVTVTIEDDDEVTVSLDVSPELVDEGAQTTITATLSTLVVMDVEVSIVTTLGSGVGSTGGTDFSTTLTNIVIPANTLTASTTLSTIQDTDEEGDETFRVYIASITATGVRSRVSNGTDSENGVEVMIRDDDGSQLSLSMPRSWRTVSEGDSAKINATLSVAVNASVVVTLAATNITAEDTDYTLPTITIPANITSMTGTLSIPQDTVVEGDETFEVYIDTITTSALVSNGTPQESAVTVSIIDDDTTMVTLSVSVSGGRRTITATLDKVLEVDVVVFLRATDSTPLSSITIPANMRSASTEGLEITEDVEVYIGGIEMLSGSSSSIPLGSISSGTSQEEPITVTVVTSRGGGGGGSIDVYVLVLFC